jgi:hypothetical protein
VIFADAAPASGTPFRFLAVLCVGLVCFLVVSGAALAVVLYQRSRRKPPSDVA